MDYIGDTEILLFVEILHPEDFFVCEGLEVIMIAKILENYDNHLPIPVTYRSPFLPDSFASSSSLFLLLKRLLLLLFLQRQGQDFNIQIFKSLIIYHFLQQNYHQNNELHQRNKMS